MARLGDALFCITLGWWGVPWGVLGTPVQFLRNVAGLFMGPDPSRPSSKLQGAVGLHVARQLMEQAQSVPPPIPRSLP